jgi:hypothetical protein
VGSFDIAATFVGVSAFKATFAFVGGLVLL